MDIINCIQYVYNWITFRPWTYPFFEDIHISYFIKYQYQVYQFLPVALSEAEGLRHWNDNSTLPVRRLIFKLSMIGYFRRNKCAHLIGLRGLKFYEKSYYDKGLYRVNHNYYSIWFNLNGARLVIIGLLSSDAMADSCTQYLRTGFANYPPSFSPFYASR
jgi:hypothetical protein